MVRSDLDLDLDLDLTNLRLAPAETPEDGENAVPADSNGVAHSASSSDLDVAEPPHACTYCGIHSTSCVAQCLQCEKWYGNCADAALTTQVLQLEGLEGRLAYHYAHGKVASQGGDAAQGLASR